MPKVLVVGATGYLGSSVCDHLVRSGDHVVYGLARSPAKATELSKKEIIPVIGSMTDTKAFLELIKTDHIDVVVNVATAGPELIPLLKDIIDAGKERLELYQKASIKGPKLGFVAVTGTWQHGSSHERIDDLTPTGTHGLAKTKPPRMTADQPPYEQAILAATDVLDVMCIRPPLMFGREATVWGAVWGPILGAAMQKSTSTLSIPLVPDCTTAICHVDDVAAGFLCAVNTLPLIAGTGVFPTFDLPAEHVNLTLVAEAAAKVFGFQGKIEMVGPGDDVFMEALGTSINATSSRARQFLGWQAKRLNFLGNIDIYTKAYMAAQSGH